MIEDMTGSGARPTARGGSSARKLLSGTALIAASSVVVVLTAVVVIVLWWPATKGLTGSELVSARFEALRIGLSIGVGSGGVVVLYLAWRRQRAMEDTLAHQERVAESTEEDARERRITDLYTKAADQLGSGKAAVRLAGLYALERLAQDHPKQRNTIVNVLCAYLRMPFDLPDDPTTLPEELLTEHRERVQEQEVRHAAQLILGIHSRPGSGGLDDAIDTYWPDLKFDLTGASLDSPDFSECHIDSLSLSGAHINGEARFDKAKFAGEARFDKVKFCGSVRFNDTEFADFAEFAWAEFADIAWFDGVKFADVARFAVVKFCNSAMFGEAKFYDSAMFEGAAFSDVAWFRKTTFAGNVEFNNVEFGGVARFDMTIFGWGVGFNEARFGSSVSFSKAKFGSDVRFDQAEFGGSVTAEDAFFMDEVPAALATPKTAEVRHQSVEEATSGE